MSTTPGAELDRRGADVARGLDIAFALGDRLRHAALRHAGECTWLGRDTSGVATDRPSHALTVRSLGGDLYAGTAGVALFLLELQRVQPMPWLPDLIREALAHAKRTIGAAEDDLRGGAYTGVPGVGLVCLRAGKVLGDREATREGIERLSLSAIDACLAQNAVDFATGVSGVVVAAAAWSHRIPAMRDVVVKGQNVLVEAAAGRTWNLSRRSEVGVNLTGLSHGYSGVAAALFAAHGVTASAGALEAARVALAAEDQWLLGRRGNWADMRRHDAVEPPRSEVARRKAPATDAWCHGAPGIAVVRRMACERLGKDSAAAAPLGLAIRSTARALTDWRRGSDVSLCHGVFGIGECLSLASGQAQDPRVDATMLRVIRAHGDDAWWPSGAPSSGPNPSLFLGMAGVGHQLLRWARGASVPSILFPTRAG